MIGNNKLLRSVLGFSILLKGLSNKFVSSKNKIVGIWNVYVIYCVNIEYKVIFVIKIVDIEWIIF